MNSRYGFWILVWLTILLHQGYASDPLVIAKIGDQAPGYDPGTVFTELSAPALTADGERVALLAEIGEEILAGKPTWWFGDRQPDGFYDLKVAAEAGMQVNGSDKVLDLYWLANPYGFGDLRPTDLFQIHLDAVTGKLAFIGYLSDPGTVGDQFSPDKEKALFIADDSGVTLVVKEGNSSFTYIFDGNPVPFVIGLGNFADFKYINDRLLMSTFAIGTLGDTNRGLFIYEDGTLHELLITTMFNEKTLTDSIIGEVSIERIGRIVLNENGIAAAVLAGRLTNEIDGIKEVSLIQARLDPSGANNTTLETVLRSLEPAPGFQNAVFNDFPEISINRYDDLAYIATVYQLDGQNKPVFSSDPDKGLYWRSLQFPSEGTITTTGSEAKGYAGIGDAVIDNIFNVQIGGDYLSCVVTYPGDPANFYGNAGILRHNVATAETEDLLFYIGGPSNVSGLGTIDSLDHILMGTNGNIVCQLGTDLGISRGVFDVSPPDSSGFVNYELLASSDQFTSFRCRNSCPGFTPILNLIGFIPRGSASSSLDYPGLGGEAGFGQWVNSNQAGWVLFTNPFDPPYDEYSVLFDIWSVIVVAADFGDAPSDGTVYTYPTLLAQDGARHSALINTPLLGETVDYETDGAPSEDADGDDMLTTDDEDGVTLPPSFPPGVVEITVTATMNGKLDAWIDFNQDSDWDDPGEKVLDSTDVVEGENILQVTVPEEVVAGTSYARFRISGSGGLAPTGLAQGGEVEDYRVTLGAPTEWAGYPIEPDGENVSTGSFLGWINISNRPHVYLYRSERYIYLPEGFVFTTGAWVWFSRQDVGPGGDPAWAGYPVAPDGQNVYTGGFLGSVNILGKPYVYVFPMHQFVYMPEALISAPGGWAWVWR